MHGESDAGPFTKAEEHGVGRRIDGILLEISARRITESKQTMGSSDMENVTQVALGKSNLVDGSSAKFEPSSSSSMMNLDETELLIQGSEAVEVMARKSSTSLGGAVRGDESHHVEVPDYLTIKPFNIEILRRIGDGGATAKVYEATWSRCPCAVKNFKPEYSRELVSLLQQELNFLIALRHPHVVRPMGLSVDIRSDVLVQLVDIGHGDDITEVKIGDCRPNFIERICERLLCVRATKWSRNDMTRNFLKWIPQVFGACTSTLLAGVRGKDQSSWQEDKSSPESYLWRKQSDENDHTLSVAELNDHLKFLKHHQTQRPQ